MATEWSGKRSWKKVNELPCTTHSSTGTPPLVASSAALASIDGIASV